MIITINLKINPNQLVLLRLERNDGHYNRSVMEGALIHRLY